MLLRISSYVSKTLSDLFIILLLLQTFSGIAFLGRKFACRWGDGRITPRLPLITKFVCHFEFSSVELSFRALAIFRRELFLKSTAVSNRLKRRRKIVSTEFFWEIMFPDDPHFLGGKFACPLRRWPNCYQDSRVQNCLLYCYYCRR